MRLRFGDKNKFFLFHDVCSIPFDLTQAGGLSFYSTPLEPATECVLLGLPLDASLTFKRHTDQLVSATKRRGNMLRCLIGSRLVYTADAVLILYKGWIRSKIEYASEVYCSFAPTHAQSLERVQSMCLRTILGALKCTPPEILQNECSASSLAVRRTI